MSSHFANHVESGQFKFETTEEGNYVACFWGVEHHPKITLSVDFEWGTGVAVAAKTGFNNVAKRRNVDVSQFTYELYFEAYLNNFVC